ncbi:MAG: TIGR00296 family protein [Candidatus Altiarchaeota archaeon]|nr:TIGR00296 family protein [Candidatus Altiarchaeota archaeon]
MKLTLTEGSEAVKYARSVIELSFKRLRPETPQALRVAFKEDRGVFVTLHTFKGHELRGCIGFPEPVMPLGKAMLQAALSAAFEDSRFPHVQEKEMDGIVVEVSILTKPELIKVKDPRDYVKEVVVGRDGLIVENGWFKGLLLPQVPVEWKWNSEEFLAQTCHKAGLSSDMWLDPRTNVYRFQAQIFTEKTPRGEVIEERISG